MYFIIQNLKALIFNLFHWNSQDAKLITETDLEKSLIEGKSLLRWGDGEVQLIYGRSIAYQEYTKELSLQLKTAILTKNRKIIVCVPLKFVCMSFFDLLKRKKLKLWGVSRAFFIKNFRFEEVGDAFGFRPESEFTYLKLIKSFLRHKENNYFIYVGSSVCEFNNFCKRVVSSDTIQIEFYAVSAKNSFVQLEDLKMHINRTLDMGNREVTVFLAAGPMGKVVINQMFDVQFIDVGHLSKFY